MYEKVNWIWEKIELETCCTKSNQISDSLPRTSCDSVLDGWVKEKVLAHKRALTLTSADLSENLLRNSTKTWRYSCATWHSDSENSLPIKLIAFIRTST